MRQRLADLMRGLAALVALLLLLVGIPVFLVVAVGSPLPAGTPTGDEVTEALTRRGIDDMVVVKTLAILLWLTWAQLAASFLVEITAVVRGRAPRRAPALSGLQVVVAKLVATSALVASIAAAPRLDPHATAAPLAPAALVSHERPAGRLAEEPSAPARREPSSAPVTYVVQRHDSLWSIAEQTLGDGFRWREIRDLNAGRTMPDGQMVTSSTETIEPGWMLELPSDATVGETAPHAPTRGAPEVVVVERGDHLWSIAEDTLANDLGREPTDAEVAPHWRRIIETNRPHLADPSNPGLLFAGQSIVVPGIGAAGEPTPEPDVQAELAAPVPTPPSVDGAESSPSTTVTSSPAVTNSARPSEASGDVDLRDEPRSSTPSGMFGAAGATIAVGVGAALLRRRRRRLLQVPPGCGTPPPPPELDEVRRDLLLAADDDHVARLSHALRDLGAALGALASTARPRLVQADGRRLEALLSSTVLPTPAGWRAEGGGTVWVREAGDGAPPVDNSGPGPAVLVAIGCQQESGQLYLDLEAEAIVSLSGDAEAARKLVNSMVLELANSPVTDDANVLVVAPDGMEPIEECEAVRLVAGWNDVADDLVTRAERSHALLAANRWPNAFIARSRAGWRDDLSPVVVVLLDVPDDARFDRLCELVATGATTLSILVAAEQPNATHIVVDGERLHLPALGITCRAQAVGPEAVARVADVLADAQHLPAQLPLIEEFSNAASLADRVVDEEPEVLVRFLGDIDVVGGRKPLTPKQTAVVAYIALHAPVAGERIEDAIWTEPTNSRRKRMSNTVSDCRFALGEDHLPFAHEGRYRVGPQVGTDLELFERRVAYAADRSPHEAVELLREALEFVRGPVFTYRSLDRSSYVWIDIENWMTTWELKVADAAVKLSDLALELGATDTAVWAAERGLLALPTNSPLTEALMKAYRAAGDVDAAQRVYERHVAALQKLGIDDIAETTIDLRDQLVEPVRPKATT